MVDLPLTRFLISVIRTLVNMTLILISIPRFQPIAKYILYPQGQNRNYLHTHAAHLKWYTVEF